MSDEAGEVTGRDRAAGEAAPPANTVRLREQLLRTASTLSPEPPVLVREWADPVRLYAPEPVGHRYLFLVAVGGQRRRTQPGLDDVVDALTAAGWSAYESHHSSSGEHWGTARRDDLDVWIYEGGGPGILTFTGLTPVMFTEPGLRQPHCTASTTSGVVCDDCHGWGVCMDCEGTCRGNVGYGHCWCRGGAGGPGSCIECEGKGEITAETPEWKRRRLKLPEPDGPDATRRPPLEDGHGSGVGALMDVAHRACACGEFRCSWRNVLVEAENHLVSRFTGACRGCCAERAYAFTLPHRRLPAPPPPPSPPGCPQCAGAPIPVTGGLHFPGSAMTRAQDLGLVAAGRGGCQVRPDDPNWRCPACGHDWRDPDRRRHRRVVDAILDDVPAT